MKTLKDRDMYQRAVLQCHDASPGTKNLLISLSLFHNFKTGQCNPSYQTLADSVGVKLAAVAKQLKQGEDLGFLRRIGSKGRHSNSYQFMVPDTAATADDDSGLTADSRTGLTADRRIGIEDANPIPPSNSTTYISESEPPTAVDTNKEDLFNREENTGERYISPSMSLVPIEASQQTSEATFFKQFYAVYPRKKAAGDAELALAQVLKKKIVTEAEIMAGVARLAAYWARRPKADIKFCPYPATWLRAHSWADELEEPSSSSGSRQTDEMEASVSVLQRWGSQ
jgi:hypothetical protein